MSQENLSHPKTFALCKLRLEKGSFSIFFYDSVLHALEELSLYYSLGNVKEIELVEKSLIITRHIPLVTEAYFNLEPQPLLENHTIEPFPFASL